MNKFKDADFVKTIPGIIRDNPDIHALGEMIEEEVKHTTEQIPKTEIFSAIEKLDEATLDILAYDLQVLWYDYRYDLETKRKVIKDCIKVYRRLGTPYAVKLALSNIFPKVKIVEWFEMEPRGQPYTFQVYLDASDRGASAEIQKIVVEKIKYYKNLRSHLDKVTYELKGIADLYVAAATMPGQELSIYPYQPDMDFDLKIQAGAGQCTGPELTIYPYFKRNLYDYRTIRFGHVDTFAREINIFPYVHRELEEESTVHLGITIPEAREITIYPYFHREYQTKAETIFQATMLIEQSVSTGPEPEPDDFYISKTIRGDTKVRIKAGVLEERSISVQPNRPVVINRDGENIIIAGEIHQTFENSLNIETSVYIGEKKQKGDKE